MITQSARYSTSPMPQPTITPSRNASRTIVTDTPNCSASPAHTPATILPAATRYQVCVSGPVPLTRLPQYRHFSASARIVSAQYGQRLVCKSSMRNLANAASLALGEQRDGAVGQRTEERPDGGVIDHQVEAERRRQKAHQPTVHRAECPDVDHQDERQGH